MSFKEFLIALAFVLSLLAPLTYYNSGINKTSWVKLDPNLLIIYEYLRKSEKNSKIVMENIYQKPLNRVGYINPFTSFTGHYSLLSDDDRLIKYGIFKKEIMKRRNDIKIFYGTESLSEHERILKEYMISYVIDEGSLKNTMHLYKVKESPPFILYKVAGL